MNEGIYVDLVSLGGETVISSPNYPADYDNDDHIEWIVNAGEGNRIDLAFLDFDVGLDIGSLLNRL